MEDMKKKPGPQAWIRERGPLWVGIVLLMAVLAVCVFYLQLTTKPMESFEIGPGNDPERWTYTLEDGTILQPVNGTFPISGTDMVVICETIITENVTDKPLLVVNANSSDCVFLLDGQLVYAASGRYSDGAFNSSPYVKASGSGQFRMSLTDSTPRLTMIVQFQGEENRMSRLPKLTLYPEIFNFLSLYTGPISGSALSVGMYFTVALFLMGLFLMGLWKQKSDFGLILLALCALSMAFQLTSSYNFNVAMMLRSPAITWFCSVLPQAVMSWMLWYRLSKKLRRISLPLPGLTTAAMLTLFILGFNNMEWVNQMQSMTAWILPGALLILLLVAALDAGKGNLVLRRFFTYLLWSLPVIALCWIYSLLTGGELAQSLKTAFSSLTGPNATLFFLCGLLCNLLLILFFIQAFLDLIRSLAQQDAEMRTLSLRESYAMENMEVMRQSQEETRRQRHELHHHIIALEEMLARGENDRAAEYLRALSEQEAALPQGTYSDNMVINAVAGYYLNRAKAEGISVKADIKTDESLPLEDEELCVLLTNLLENALEACLAMKPEQDRFLSLHIASREEHLLIDCENSTDAEITVLPDGTIPSAKSDKKNHGYGISSIRRIIEKHYGMLEISCTEGRFQIVITV